MIRLIPTLTIITFMMTGLSCLNSSSQIKFGSYRQYTKHHYGDLEIFNDHKFLFDDMRSGSCFAWSKYEGDWTMQKDTLILSWQTSWEEYPVHISSSIDQLDKGISLTFKYEDNKPIQNVKVYSLCEFTADSKYYYTNKEGKVNIPLKQSANNEDKYCTNQNQVGFEIKGGAKGITAYEQYGNSDNVFTIMVEKKLRSFQAIETRKFLIVKNNLISLDSRNKSYYDNWGNFKFLTKKQKGLDDQPVKVTP